MSPSKRVEVAVLFLTVVALAATTPASAGPLGTVTFLNTGLEPSASGNASAASAPRTFFT